MLEQFLSRRDGEAEAAFAALVAFHGPMVWDVCRGILSDSHAAEDAFQATFLVLVRRAGSIRRRDAVGPWLTEWPGGSRCGPGLTRPGAGCVRRMEQEKTVAFQGRSDPPGRVRDAVRGGRPPGGEIPRTTGALLPRGPYACRGRPSAEMPGRDGERQAFTRPGSAPDPLDPPGGGPARLCRGRVVRSSERHDRDARRARESTIKAAMQLAASKVMTAGVVPASVTQLVAGEMRTMVFTRLTWIAAGLLAIGSVSVGMSQLAANRQPGPPNVDPAPVAVARVQGQDNEDDAKSRAESMNNLKTIGLAMHNFAAAHDTTFPAAAIRKDGKPLLSWRVAILAVPRPGGALQQVPPGRTLG